MLGALVGALGGAIFKDVAGLTDKAFTMGGVLKPGDKAVKPPTSLVAVVALMDSI